jgi:hypothetical protein
MCRFDKTAILFGDFNSISGLKLAEQNQDQHDNEYKTEPAAAVVTGPVERAASEPAKASE